MEVICVPELDGLDITTTYSNGIAVSGYVPVGGEVIETSGFEQAIVCKGKLVKTKTGEQRPLYYDLDTFGRDRHFPSYTNVLDFLDRAGLPVVPVYPVARDIPLKFLYQWSLYHPFYFSRVKKVYTETKSEVSWPLPTKGWVTRVEKIVWKQVAEKFIPVLQLKDEVEFKGEKVTSIDMRSWIALRMNGIYTGVELGIFDDMLMGLGDAVKVETYPSRCYTCNSPTKKTTFHIECPKGCGKGT